jgi:hypothetical protein
VGQHSDEYYPKGKTPGSSTKGQNVRMLRNAMNEKGIAD